MLSLLLALAAAGCWGVSDFLGGVTSRRLPLLWVLTLTQFVGFTCVVPIAVLRGPVVLDAATLQAAVAGSLFGLLGIAGLYLAIALGVASIAAPISATGAVLPVVVGLVRGEPATLLQELGCASAVLGIVGASHSGQEQSRLGRAATTGVGYALLAALGFGGFFVFLPLASQHDVFWAVSIQRLTGFVVVSLIVLVRRPARGVQWRDAPRLVLIGVLDQGANVLYGLASTLGLLSLSAVLASLYPLVTVVLARVVLNERLSRLQQTGVALALAGVALVAGG